MGHGFEKVDALDGITEWRLPSNGLRVLTAPSPVAPVVSTSLVYLVGSRYEVTGQTGATHLLEHLMFKGTRRFNAERGTAIATVLDRLGASFNATTWLDRTNYFATVPPEALEGVLEVEADRMRGALIREQDLESERTVVLNELDIGENDPVEVLHKHTIAVAYLEHPYRHPTIGWRSDVESMPLEVLRSYYDTYYHPDNAVLIVGGAIEEGATLELVERLFGAIPPGDRPRPEPRTRESEQRGERRLVVRRAGEVPRVLLSWHAPEALDPESAAFDIVSGVLTDGVTARLHRRLVETNRCLGINSWIWSTRDPGLYQLFAVLEPEEDLAGVEAVIREEVARLAKEPLTERELARTRAKGETDLAFARETPLGTVLGLTEAVAAGDWREYPRLMERLEALTPETVREVARRYLHDDNLTVGWFVPDPASGEAGGRAASGSRPGPCPYRAPLEERAVRYDLPGGAELTVVRNPYAPTASIVGSLPVTGSYATERDRLLPDFTARMLHRGTARHDRLGLAEELEDHGLELHYECPASAMPLMLVWATGLSREFRRLASLLVETLREPAFPEDEVEKVRQWLLAALEHRRENPSSRVGDLLREALYPIDHPYGIPSYEQRIEGIRALSRDDLVSHHRRTFGPRALKLVVVGDVEPEAVHSLFSELLDGWEGGLGTMAPCGRPVEEPERELQARMDDRPNIEVLMGHATELTRAAPDFVPAILGNACLGHSTLTSRLGREVRDRAGLTYGITSRFPFALFYPGPWTVAFSVARQDLERAIGLVRSVVERFVAEGPGEDELENERMAFLGWRLRSLATNQEIAREILTLRSIGQPIRAAEEFGERIRRVTREEVAAAVRRHIHPERMVVAMAGSL